MELTWIENVALALDASYVTEVAQDIAEWIDRMQEPRARLHALGNILLIAPQDFTMPDRQSILAMHNWDWVQLSTAGYDFFPVASLPRQALLSRCTEAYNAPISEYVLREMFRWSKGTGLKGRKVGIVGYGNIARHLAKLLELLEMDVLVFRRSAAIEPPASIRFVHEIEGLQGCDYIVPLLPLNDSCRGIISAQFLWGMKPGATVINASRGEHVDQNALLEVCIARGLRASLDVTVPEPLSPCHPLRHLDNVKVTDHCAWKSGDWDHYFLSDFYRNLERRLSGLHLLGQLERTV